MKQLESIENEQVCLEVIECNCGFHFGIDSSWLDSNEIDYLFHCPSCGLMINVNQLTDPNSNERSNQ